MVAMADSQVIFCEKCGAANRVPLDKLQPGRMPVCGRCKAPLTIDPHPLNVTDATFSAEVEQSPVPVLVDMWAPWCGPCRMVAPVLEQLSAELAGKIRVAKVNVDENPITSERFRIQSIPALLIFKNGQEIDRMVGAQPKSEIARRLQRVMS